uniref:Uncharacterized protein n=1 Tax=Steinernema glaseri TaxID=37863 RepID=A0A1I8A5G2_9BILA
METNRNVNHARRSSDHRKRQLLYGVLRKLWDLEKTLSQRMSTKVYCREPDNFENDGSDRVVLVNFKLQEFVEYREDSYVFLLYLLVL